MHLKEWSLIGIKVGKGHLGIKLMGLGIVVPLPELEILGLGLVLGFLVLIVEQILGYFLIFFLFEYLECTGGSLLQGKIGNFFVL